MEQETKVKQLTPSSNETNIKRKPTPPPRPPPPSRPPPPQLSITSNYDTISDASASTDEAFEAGKSATLPRHKAVNIEENSNRRKSVSFAQAALYHYNNQNRTAVIRRAHTPYYDARRFMSEM